MSIRNEITLDSYDFISNMISFRIKLDSDVFVNKLWDDEVVDVSMEVQSEEDEDGNPHVIIWGSIESFEIMVCKGLPYKDSEVEEFLDAISIILEQLPQTFRNVAKTIEET